MNQAILDRMTAMLGLVLQKALTGATSRWVDHLPKVLWHYTRPEAFLNIMKHGTLRASHLRFMNDEGEYIHATQLAVDAITAARSMATSADAQAVLAEMDGFFRMGLSLGTANSVFAASLSAKRDDLSQWRAYGGPEGGISLGFGFQALEDRVHANGAQELLVPVEYDDARKKQIAVELVHRSIQLYEKFKSEGAQVSAKDYAFALNAKSTEFAALPKHKTFEAEDEWRIVRKAEPSDLPKVVFLGRETVVTPAWDFNLKLSDTGRLPLAEIVVGPGRMASHSVAAIKALLLQKGYSMAIPVTSSGVPYRVVK